MIILLLMFFLIMTIVGICEQEDGIWGTAGVLFICDLIALLMVSDSLIRLRVINDEIKLYTEQNKQIELKIDEVVKAYMEYEHQTFADLSNKDSSMVLITLYPELKSDKLVEEQINVYVENNKKIVEAKKALLRGTVYKWWLYFGK